MTSMDATLALWRRSKFAWGQADCILSVCDHVLAMTGIDPAAPWRGTYHDEAGAVAIYESFGGPLALFTHGMALAGFKTTANPKIGDPVVCDVGGHEIAGFRSGRLMAFMTEHRGCIELKARVLSAWAI